MKLSIIIINWNTRHLLLRCLESIINYSINYDYEIWVVDNASTDNSLANIDEIFPQVRFIKNIENVGFGRANNQAFHSAHGDYLLLLNPDTQVYPAAINTMVAYMDACPKAAAIGSQLLDDKGSVQISAFPAPNLGNELWRLFHLDTIISIGHYRKSNFCNKPVKVDVLMGACLLIRKEAVKNTYLFDEDFFMYSEEVDLCERIRKGGWEIHWIPNAQVIHYGGMSTQLVAKAMFLELYRSKIKFFRKHRGLFQTTLYKVILGAAAVVRIIFGRIIFQFITSDQEKWASKIGNYQTLLAELFRI